MTKETALVIVLAGLTGTGKTTIQRLLRRGLRVHSILLGRLLEQKASKQGKTVKQYVSEIEKIKGKIGVIKSITPELQRIAKRKNVLMVEELHRPEDLNVIKKIFPNAEIFMVEVQASPELRLKRIMTREKMTESQAKELMKKYDKMQHEMGYTTLVRMADTKILNEGLPLNRYYGELLQKAQNKSPKIRNTIKKLRQKRGRAR